MNKLALVFATMMVISPIAIANQTLDAAVGGALGGAVGGAIGSELGGRDGAIIGAGVGAAAGSAMMTKEDYEYDRPHYPKKQRVYYNNYYYGHPHGRFCPPGLAKQGRC